ncbi:MAG: T9SS type A sorting domain-containing protein [Chitinophagales bacterium]|nr:T9SS type A sorting domain-containing protein [Chitinophagales bacterium]
MNSLSLLAQLNLIPNGGFEEYSACPQFQSQFYLVKSWFNPSDNSPDYFNSCAPPLPLINSVHVPDNSIGWQNAFEGVAYAGSAMIYNNLDGREYISCKLNDSLNSNTQYLLTFYVSLADICNAAVGSIGAYFMHDSAHFKTIDTINVQPQIQHPINSIIKDTANWVQISDTFTANGEEKFMIIGNFLDDAHTLVDTLVPNQIGYTAYYYIDDVSLYEVTEDTQINHPFFNNPIAIGHIQKPLEPLIIPSLLSANSDVYWQFINLQEKTSLKLYNAIGQLAFSTANYQNNLTVSLLAAGVYFYEVQITSGEILKGKLVVIR